MKMRTSTNGHHGSMRRVAPVIVLLILLCLCGCGKLESLRPESLQQSQSETQQTPAETQTPEPEAQEQPEPEAPEEEPEEPLQEPEETAQEPEEPAQESEDESWKLILVNADHPMPEGYSVTLKELRNDQWVDERIYPELQQMFDDARAEGVYPLINESYRSAERQQEILDSYIDTYLASGMEEEEARAEALKLVAVPGTSEHQLGLALDIISETDEDDTATWQWLNENCWRYGFILRYPEEKIQITGITYEPWHFRYVGVEAAQEITEQGITLEEYLGEE